MTGENLKGELDFGSIRRELYSFNSVTIETGSVSANGTELFEVDEDEDIVSSLTYTPTDENLPKFGRFLAIRINIESGSTNTTLTLYEDETGNAIDQTAQITNLDANDSPESFVLGGDAGIPFVNQQDENTVHLEIDELSGIQSEYEIKLIWSNVNTKEVNFSAL